MTTPLETLLSVGDFAEAAAIAEARLEANPDDVDAHVTLARVCLGNDDVAGAQRHLSSLAAGAGGYLGEVTRATLLAASGSLEEALALFRAQAKAAPDRPEAYVGLATVAAGQGDAALELRAWKKAALAAPDDFWVHYRLGIAFAEQGDAERATASLTQAFKLNPTDIRPVSALVAGLLELNALEAAEDLLREYGQTSENPQSIALLVQVLVRKGELDEARNLAVLNANMNPEQPGLQTEAARLLLTTGEPAAIQDAVARTDALITAGAATVLTYMVRAQAAELLKDYAGAVQLYLAALETEDGKDDASLHTNLGLLHLEYGDARDAEAPLERALALTPKSAEALYNVALVSAVLGKPPRARECLTQCLELTSSLAMQGLRVEAQRLLATLPA